MKVENEKIGDWQCDNCEKDVDDPAYQYCAKCTAKQLAEKDRQIEELENRIKKEIQDHGKTAELLDKRNKENEDKKAK